MVGIKHNSGAGEAFIEGCATKYMAWSMYLYLGGNVSTVLGHALAQGRSRYITLKYGTQ